jgi:hypothetical protein
MLTGLSSFFTWSRRDSNPRPNEVSICFLHAYPAFGFRQVLANWRAMNLLSFFISSTPEACVDYPGICGAPIRTQQGEASGGTKLVKTES